MAPIPESGPASAQTPSILFSTSPDFFGAAVSQWRSEFHEPVTITRLASDAGLIANLNQPLADLSTLCRTRPLPFIRHLTCVRATLPNQADGPEITSLTTELGRLNTHLKREKRVALQLWSSDCSTRTPLVEIKRACENALRQESLEVVSGNAPMTVHVCITPRATLVGLANSTETLSDWPGGRMRLRKEPEQVSRAELKLEEAIAIFDLDFERGGTGIDLGASPGGWTRILRKHGVTVHAVDPAALAPSLLKDRGVIHHRVTAQQFLADTDLQVEFLLNDMRMSIAESCEWMLQGRRCLKPGGVAVLTLKISERDAVRTVLEALGKLRTEYRVQGARQLYHNRHEVTVVLTH